MSRKIDLLRESVTFFDQRGGVRPLFPFAMIPRFLRRVESESVAESADVVREFVPMVYANPLPEIREVFSPATMRDFATSFRFAHDPPKSSRTSAPATAANATASNPTTNQRREIRSPAFVRASES